MEWAEQNAVSFDSDKTEAVLLTRKRAVDWDTEIPITGQAVKLNRQRGWEHTQT